MNHTKQSPTPTEEVVQAPNYMTIPKHVIHSGNKRIYKKIMKRAGLYSNSSSLSCLGMTRTDEPWLEAASLKLLHEIESTRAEMFGSTVKSSGMGKSKRVEVVMNKEVPRDSDAIRERVDYAESFGGKGIVFEYPGRPLQNSAMKDGFGKYDFVNGTIYIGNWRQSKPNGHGKAIYPSGTAYEGSWKDGNWIGEGKLINPDGSYYEGGFLFRFHGQGKFISPVLGITYTGEFRNGNVIEWAQIEFSDGENIRKKWPSNSRLSLSEAIQKLVKEKRKRVSEVENESSREVLSK
ncbi:hypothetical protein ACHAXS_013648 [Conticribra weissflogii]